EVFVFRGFVFSHRVPSRVGLARPEHRHVAHHDETPRTRSAHRLCKGGQGSAPSTRLRRDTDHFFAVNGTGGGPRRGARPPGAPAGAPGWGRRRPWPRAPPGG